MLWCPGGLKQIWHRPGPMSPIGRLFQDRASPFVLAEAGRRQGRALPLPKQLQGPRKIAFGNGNDSGGLSGP
jgi:hypothetical protein